MLIVLIIGPIENRSDRECPFGAPYSLVAVEILYAVRKLKDLTYDFEEVLEILFWVDKLHLTIWVSYLLTLFKPYDLVLIDERVLVV